MLCERYSLMQDFKKSFIGCRILLVLFSLFIKIFYFLSYSVISPTIIIFIEYVDKIIMIFNVEFAILLVVCGLLSRHCEGTRDW